MGSAVTLSLLAAIAWGSADFVAGRQSRVLGAFVVLWWSQLISGAVLAALMLLSGLAAPAEVVAYGAAAGAVGALALLAFYRAMTIGAISLVTPISGCGAVITIAVALARGERPGALALVGVVVAFLGVLLVSLTPDERGTDTPAIARLPRQALVLSLVAAVGFSGFFLLLDAAADRASGLAQVWAAVGARGGSVLLLLAILLSRAARAPWPGRLVGLVILAGLLDVLANTAIALAVARGNLAVVSVLSSLYPAATVLLARVLLGERLTRRQDVGIACAVVGVALIAAAR